MAYTIQAALHARVFNRVLRHARGGEVWRALERGVRVFVRSVFLQGLAFLSPAAADVPDLPTSILESQRW